MKYFTYGLVAHVDAGKTTLSEGLLLSAGAIASAGRVDHGDAFLDTDSMEKSRGITIFSKQAVFEKEGVQYTLLDTPGHADFSAEMERALSVLDAAVLIVSGSEGVQAHTRTLWRLLEAYEVPTFIFVNKMDMDGADKDKVLAELQSELGNSCQDYSDEEAIASADETLIEEYLEQGGLSPDSLATAFFERKVFPVWFGSALKQEGVQGFLNDIANFAKYYVREDSENSFGAFVYKITHDSKGEKEACIKVTSGTLKVRDVIGDEKVTSIRLYNGAKCENLQEASAGQVVSVTGISSALPGAGLGEFTGESKPLLTPVMSYRMVLPREVDVAVALPKLYKIAQEDPDLSLEYDEEKKEISVKLMGEIQTEILKQRILDRFGYEISFSESRIVYRETIASPCYGVGHFEPLRHYAEAHIIMEPLPRGSGLEFDADCSEDILDKNWQRLILTHLKERWHRGVLTGSPITDIKFTVVSGRAHTKHTEGGDFRQATYRAVRQGLMEAESILLEPYYRFELTVPSDCVGRAMTDLERMFAKDFSPEIVGDGTFTRLKGLAPVSTIGSYGSDVIAYTKGLGSLSLALSGYEVCHNAEEVIEARNYDPVSDLRNTPDSVFCSHGAGVVVPWNEVKANMHMPSVLSPTKELTDEMIRKQAMDRAMAARDRAQSLSESGFISQDEIKSILGAAGGNNKDKTFVAHKGINRQNIKRESGGETSAEPKKLKPVQIKPSYLLVDGYNIIFAWEDLRELARDNLDSARGALEDIMSNYQAIKGCEVIIVYDAYKLKNHAEEYLDVNNIHIVFTKTAETADRYIEKFGLSHGKEYNLTVATSDGAEQIIVRGDNGRILSARDLKAEVDFETKNFNQIYDVN